MSCEILRRESTDGSHANQTLPRWDGVSLDGNLPHLPHVVSPAPYSRAEDGRHGRSLSPKTSPHWSLIEPVGPPNACKPPLGPLRKIGMLERLDDEGNSTLIDIQINSVIDKGFFQSDGEWTCYRRNYFSVMCSYALYPEELDRSVQYTLPGSPMPFKVHGFAMAISAVVADNDERVVELVQHTPKRDKGPSQKPKVVRLSPTTASPRQGQQPSTVEHTFERLQFKLSTANNGRRRAEQQYYQLVVGLLADVGEHVDGGFVMIAQRRSVNLIVRGRSPGHYQTGRGKSLGSSLGSLGSGARRVGGEFYSPLHILFGGDTRPPSNYPRPTTPKNLNHLETFPPKAHKNAPEKLDEKKHASSQDIPVTLAACKTEQTMETEINHVVKRDTSFDSRTVLPRSKPPEIDATDVIPGSGESSGSASATEEISVSEEDEEAAWSAWMFEKKQMVIDGVMRSLCIWLDSRLASIRSAAANQGDAAGCAMGASDSTWPSRSGAGEQGMGHSQPLKRRRMDADDDDNHGEGPGRKAELDEIKHTHELRRFACPYFKRDPWKYCREATCMGPGWIEIHRVKGHLYRRHALPPQCPRCWQVFKTESLRDIHIQNDPPCQTRENDSVLDGFTKAQEKQLKSRKKSEMQMTGAGKWREIYQILFPDDDPATIPGPYHEDVSAVLKPGASRCSTPADFAAFARREFPRFVRRELEILFQSEFQDVEERVRPRVQDIVLNLQPRLIALYERSAVDSEKGAAPGAEILSIPRGDLEMEEAQSQGLPSLRAPNSNLGTGFSASWLPSHSLEPPSLEFEIDWNLISEDLFAYPLQGQFAPPQDIISPQDDLQVVGQRQPAIGI